MKQFFSLSVLSAMIMISSCKKNGLPADRIRNLRVKTITGAAGTAAQGYLNQLTYDASGRIIKEEENDQVSEYIYAPGKMTRKITHSNQQVDVFEFELNADGYARSSRKKGEPVLYSYEYKAGGLLVRTWDDQVPQYQARYYYQQTEAGLLDSIRSTIGGVWSSTATFAYDMSRQNSLQNENLGQTASARIHTRPLTKYTYKYDEGGVVKTQTTNYFYTYNADGLIIHRSFESAGQTMGYNYTYY